MADVTIQPFSWRAHPARERRAQAVMALGVIAAFCVVVFLAFASWAWTALCFVVLVASLSRFFFPSRFEIDDEGITARYPLRRMRLRWTELRRFVHDRYGGYLSTRARPSRLDAFKGMHILFGAQRDRVVATIDRLVKREHPA